MTTIQQKKAALELKLAHVRAREKQLVRKQETRRKIILGGACLRAANDSADFADVLSKIL